jgi:sarcosine oxidase subunit delta
MGRHGGITQVAFGATGGARPMRLTCPVCGERDLREFAYRGSAKLLARPDPEAGAAAFHDYLNLRENPAGPNAELWHHVGGCRAWLRVVRDTRSHAVLEVGLARESAR